MSSSSSDKSLQQAHGRRRYLREAGGARLRGKGGEGPWLRTEDARRGAAAPAEPRREREVSAAGPGAGPEGSVPLLSRPGCRGKGRERGYGPAFRGRSTGVRGGAAALLARMLAGKIL